jgi:hypothetical protein
MSRHRGMLSAYDEYESEKYEEEKDDYGYIPSSYQAAPPENYNPVQLGNFVTITPAKKQSQRNKKRGKNNFTESPASSVAAAAPAPLTASQQSFIQQARDILGSKMSLDELIDILTRNSGNAEQAISFLLDQESTSASPTASSQPSEMATTAHDVPPGFVQKEMVATPAKYTKPPTPSSLTGGVTVLGRKPPASDNMMTPNKGTQVSSLTKAAFGGQNRSPAPSSPFPATPPSISRNNSGQINRMAALSDDDWDETDALKAEGTLPHLSMVVAGHVDAGKSTLVGNFLLKIGTVQSKDVRKHQRNAQAKGKGSFYLAWVMDESESEREHGVTIGVAERFRSLSLLSPVLFPHSFSLPLIAISKLRCMTSQFLMLQVIEISFPISSLVPPKPTLLFLW